MGRICWPQVWTQGGRVRAAVALKDRAIRRVMSACSSGGRVVVAEVHWMASKSRRHIDSLVLVYGMADGDELIARAQEMELYNRKCSRCSTSHRSQGRVWYMYARTRISWKHQQR